MHEFLLPVWRPARVLSMVWHAYLSLLRRYPLPTKAATATTVAFFADFVCQRLESAGKVVPFDADRAFRFASWALVTTPVVHVWYRFLHAKLASPLLRAAADQFIYAPPATCLFLFCMGVGVRGSGVEGGLARVAHLPGVLKENWMVWLPLQLINFAFVPLPLQIGFGNICGAFWAVRLSALAQSGAAQPLPVAPKAPLA